MQKFPVKFPVCREFDWRLVQSALRRQPATRSTYDSVHLSHKKPAKHGLSCVLRDVSRLRKRATNARILKVSGRYLKYSRFRETFGGDFFDLH